METMNKMQNDQALSKLKNEEKCFQQLWKLLVMYFVLLLLVAV